jgi:hypothetical protein
MMLAKFPISMKWVMQHEITGDMRFHVIVVNYRVILILSCVVFGLKDCRHCKTAYQATIEHHNN